MTLGVAPSLGDVHFGASGVYHARAVAVPL